MLQVEFCCIFGEEPTSNAYLCTQVVRSVVMILRHLRANATSTFHENVASLLYLRQIGVHVGENLATKSAIDHLNFILFMHRKLMRG